MILPLHPKTSARMRLVAWIALASCIVACQRQESPASSSKPLGAATVVSSAPLAPSPVESVTAKVATDEPNEACEFAVDRIVNAQPQVKRELAIAQREAEQSHGKARFGGIGPNYDDDGGFGASIGIHTDDGFDDRVSYAVDHAGLLTVTVGGEELKLPASKLQDAKRACAR
ncbi:MAG: hypothetical protein ABIQ16_00795 [Polyangiaceae bacterium]